MSSVHSRQRDHFALFDLPRRYTLDPSLLEEKYRQLQAAVHPDKHITADEAQRRRAAQWASTANEAWSVLRDPLSRARYLLQLSGIDAALETHTAMPQDFLLRQIELREAVAAAAGKPKRLDELHRAACDDLARLIERIRDALDRTHDLPRATNLVREAMFQNKLIEEIERALDGE